MDELLSCPFCGDKPEILAELEEFQIIGCNNPLKTMICPRPSMTAYKKNGEWNYSYWNTRWSEQIDGIMKEKRSLQPKKLKAVVCPQCVSPFHLVWDELGLKTLIIRSYPECGVCNVSISCPHCDYEEEL